MAKTPIQSNVLFWRKYEFIQRCPLELRLNPKQCCSSSSTQSYVHARHGCSERQDDCLRLWKRCSSGYFKFFRILALNTWSGGYLGMPLHGNLKEYNYYPVDFSSNKWKFYFFAQWPNLYQLLGPETRFFLITPIPNPGFFSAWYTVSTGPGVLQLLLLLI